MSKVDLIMYTWPTTQPYQLMIIFLMILELALIVDCQYIDYVFFFIYHFKYQLLNNQRLCSVMVSTQDSDSCNPGSIPGTTYLFCLPPMVLTRETLYLLPPPPYFAASFWHLPLSAELAGWSLRLYRAMDPQFAYTIFTQISPMQNAHDPALNLDILQYIKLWVTHCQ